MKLAERCEDVFPSLTSSGDCCMDCSYVTVNVHRTADDSDLKRLKAQDLLGDGSFGILC